MKLKKFFLGSAIHFCVLMTVLSIWLFCLQATIMNREVVKSWISRSAIYEKITPLIGANASTAGAAGELLNQAQINQLVANIYPAGQIRTQTESSVDSFYDWTDGKVPTLKISNPFAIVPADLQTQLASALKEGSANLAVCTAQLVANNQLCRPANVSVETFSQNLAKQAVANVPQPVTTQAVATSNSSVGALPSVKQIFNWLIVLAPLIACGCLGLVLWLGRDNKIVIYKRTLRQLIVAVIVPVAFVTLAIYTVQKVTTLSGLVPATNLAMVDLFLPLIKNAVQSVGGKFLGIALPVLGAAILAWIGLYFLHKSQKETHAVTPEAPYLDQQ